MTSTATQAPVADLDSVLEMILDGGPFMIPIALCSVVALAYTVERWMRLGSGRLGTRGFARDLLSAAKDGGRERAIEVCRKRETPLGRVMRTALEHSSSPYLEREKAVEDAGAREVRRLAANLRPLVVVAKIAPLLGLLGTVWGMIVAFSTIALRDGLGKPELLASGISQALITTAAGLAIAIPTQAAYDYFRGKIERFTRKTEEVYTGLNEVLTGGAQHANP